MINTIKNWKNAGDYSYLQSGKLSQHVWVWEFLRRNKEYNEDWNKYLKLKLDYQKIYGAGWAQNKKTHVYIPEKKPDETEKMWADRWRGKTLDSPQILPLETFYCNKWGLLENVFLDPALVLLKDKIFVMSFDDYPKVIKHSYDLKKYAVQDNKIKCVSTFEEIYLDGIDESKVIFVFDLNKPMTAQINNMKPIFKNYHDAYNIKDEGFKNKKDMFLVYLRLLDAFTGQSPQWVEIASVIYPNLENAKPNYPISERLKDNFEVARKIASDPFRILTKGI